MKKLFVLIIFLSYSCKESDQGEQPMNSAVVDEYNDKEKMDELCRKALTEGDTVAFWELNRIFVVSEHSSEFAYISTVMAERYHYGPAFRQNYKMLRNQKGIMKTIAVYNLLKSHELGNRKDMRDLEELFPEGIPTAAGYWKRNNVGARQAKQ